MVALASISATSARADMILLMFEEPGCVWCARWTEDVGGEYPITPEGMAAPLVRIDLRDQPPEGVTLVSPARYSPTFVVVENGIELGRIEGYPGEDFFWGLLGRILERATPES
ncbi:thioredoxin family protein [Roseibacterium sp. SDUM158016]|uniref:thioredoxin family protein n=1 Tax=Roseicyclus sediminis TaxID=2980997 RepID=UPI0021D1DF67|nr:thioredoxin family protein [Roseibacterium sp. SDUM158016]MCU4651416.1 thioredoxin family protein [Roseibacterium sp. SDUM158016]